MDYPIYGPWSDPAVKDTKLLLGLADLDTNVAAGVVANPNFPAEHLVRTLASIPLTVDRAAAIGKYATGRLDDAQQVHLLGRAAAKSEAARAHIATGMTDSGLLAALQSQTLPNDVKRAVVDVVGNRAENTPPADISDDLRHAVASAARLRRQAMRSIAIVNAWQLTDTAVMTELLADGPILGTPTVGIAGLADDWFTRGGTFRANAAQDPDINVETVVTWLVDASHTDVETLVALCSNPAIPVEPLIQTTLRLHKQRWSTDPDERLHVSVAARRIGDALDLRLGAAFPEISGPVTQMDAGHAKLARVVTDVNSGTWSALVLNPHTPAEVKADLLGRARTARPTLTAIVEREVRRLVATPEFGVTVADIANWFRLPTPSAEPTWRTTRTQCPPPDARSTVGTRMATRVVKMTTAVVHPDAPHLADVLVKASSWAALFELGENGQNYEQALAAVLADQHATSRADAMVSLLGNAFGDD